MMSMKCVNLMCRTARPVASDHRDRKAGYKVRSTCEHRPRERSDKVRT